MASRGTVEGLGIDHGCCDGHHWWFRLPGVFLVALAALLVACGAPEYTYVTNSKDRTYLRVPVSWQEIDQRALDAALGIDPTVSSEEQGVWMRGFDADPAPSPSHLFGPNAAAPAAFVTVQQIPEPMRGEISFDRLRDLFYPASPSSRQLVAAFGEYSEFTLISDEVLTPGNGVRGVHTVFRYRRGDDPAQIVNQVAYINDDASTVYAFFVRCSSECYEQRKKEIEAVVSSYTVRGNR